MLAVTGSTTLGGTLLLEFIDGFAPHRAMNSSSSTLAVRWAGRSKRSKSATYCPASNLTSAVTAVG